MVVALKNSMKMTNYCATPSRSPARKGGVFLFAMSVNGSCLKPSLDFFQDTLQQWAVITKENGNEDNDRNSSDADEVIDCDTNDD